VSHDWEGFEKYLTDLVKGSGLSMREASIRCGLAPETVSVILRRIRYGVPRPETLRAIADGLGGDYETMMILAGHLQAPALDLELDNDQDLRRDLLRLAMLWARVKNVAPELLPQLTDQAADQAQLILAMAEIQEKEEKTPR
jgi:transcriptional regulator with XRE-family HTH domain